MIQITRRAGAFVSAAILAVYCLASADTGAVAQDQGAPVALEPASVTQLADAQPPRQQVRFVATPVVQDLPEEPADPQPAADAASLGDLVATMPQGAQLSRELMCLAQAVYFESRGEPLNGQLAVAQVIVNRADSPRFPDDYCSVVTQRSQFSFVRGGAIPTPNTNSSAWQRARAIARIAHGDLWDSLADDALYFHANHVSPRWAHKLARRGQINRHVFYR